MAGRHRLKLRTDPPPDLAIKVDVTHSSLNHLSISAKLGVPEVWRLEGNVLTFYVLGAEGTYLAAVASRSFPLVSPADLVGFLQQARQAGMRMWSCGNSATGSGSAMAQQDHPQQHPEGPHLLPMHHSAFFPRR